MRSAERALFQLHGQCAASGIGPEGVVAEIPGQTCLFCWHPRGMQFLSIKCADNWYLEPLSPVFLHEHQRFIEEAANIGMLKFRKSSLEIVEKVRDDIV